MVLARDVAAATVHAAGSGGTFNLTDGIHPSYAQLTDGLARLLGVPRPPSIPVGLARPMALAGDVFGEVLGRRLPFDSERLSKMTASLTFDDRRAREAFGWSPGAVLDALEWILS